MMIIMIDSIIVILIIVILLIILIILIIQIVTMIICCRFRLLRKMAGNVIVDLRKPSNEHEIQDRIGATGLRFRREHLCTIICEVHNNNDNDNDDDDNNDDDSTTRE